MRAPIAKRIIPFDPFPSDSTISNTALGDCAPLTPPLIPSICASNTFQLALNLAAKRQRMLLLAIDTSMYGVQAAIFNPRFDTSVYNQDAEDYNYPTTPDWEGKVLIKGLNTPEQRWAGEDQYTFDRTELWWSPVLGFEPKEQCLIHVNYGDLKLSFRALNKRRFMGIFVELTDIYELVSYN